MKAQANRIAKWLLGMVGAVALHAGVYAAVTDLADAPLATSAPSTILPNLMFVLDDSGSMDLDFMPDSTNDSYCRNNASTSLATDVDSGDFNRPCCNDNTDTTGSDSNACWRGSAPFGTWRGHPPFMSSEFNGVYYNPAIRYQPPVDAAGTSYPSQTSAATSGWTSVKNDAYNVQNTNSINLLTQFPDTEWCTDTAYTDCLRNGNYVLPGNVNGKAYTTFRATVASGSGSMAVGSPTAATIEARSWGPHYYTIVPAEYCDNVNLRNCQATQTAVFSHPAPVRWCKDDANARAAAPAVNACQGLRTTTYTQARYPTKFFAAGTAGTPAVAEVRAYTQFTISTSGCNGGRQVSVSSVRVNGPNTELLGSPTALTNGSNALAANIRNAINASGTGYVATGSNNTVRITAPAGVVLTNANSVTITNNPTTPALASARCNFTTTGSLVFGGYAAAVPATPGTPGTFPGGFTRVDIVPTTTSYPKSAKRADCAGTTCTYAEEMTNFANWWTYYRSRMQTMKTAASLAFSRVSNQFRVGFISLNNAAGSQFMNVQQFEGSAKTTWFSKLISAQPSGATPLRGTLSRVGRLYAGKLNGTSVNGVTAVDPMQYSCQQNFTLLSTDGFWNETALPVDINGAAIGDRDSALPRPLLDGRSASNTLADVAAYYYETDLRTDCTSGPDLCTNNVPTGSVDVATHQHMTTFTLGLGASGYMQFVPNYATATSGDFFNIKNGTTADPTNGICSWETSGTCNWPIPSNNSLTGIDDLWHAAVNGRGTYFSATDPSTLSAGLESALKAIDEDTGSAAAAVTSNPNLSAGDNYVFSSTFVSAAWTGELVRRQISLSSGSVSSTVDWAAAALLDAKAEAGTRTIYTYDPSDIADRLKSFEWDSLTTAEQGYFSKTYVKSGSNPLTQFCTTGTMCLSDAAQDDAAGANLVAFLRGSRVHEDTAADPSRYYRQRKHVLGDIVGSEAVYVKRPIYNYADSGYAAYKSAKASRPATVYVGANDGMLHAFDADSGEERWAYVPSEVMPRLYKLADKAYRTSHQFYVDSSPVIADVYFGGQWHTVLVGGLGKGGRGYYALDVTDPTAPKALWEFSHDTAKGTGYTTDANLGYTYGKASIGKLRDGTWTVIVPSGYNNVSPGTGRGYLFVLNAQTGALVRTIDTGEGSTGTPSGLAHISSWADSPEIDNTTARVYGGDLLGNVWRFDVNNEIGDSGYDAEKLATLLSSTGSVQPVTARPELGTVLGHPVVFVGTGRYLGVSDFADSSGQSIYAIKDKLTGTGYGSPRDLTGSFVRQTLTDQKCPADSTVCEPGQDVRLGSSNAMSFATQDGWYVDLPKSSERANTDPRLVLGTLVFTTNVIASSACTAEGSSYVNYFDYKTGGAVTTAAGVVSVFLGNNVASSPAIFSTGSKKGGVVSTSGGDLEELKPPFNNLNGGTRRLSWRELATQQ
jgi:type IV pilus assembly protein PilY1